MEDVNSSLYLELLKKTLTNWIYGDFENPPMDTHKRAFGVDWPPFAHTVSGLNRLNQMEEIIRQIVAEGVPGDLIECGAWRGGMAIFMRAVLKTLDVKDRVVFVADSFQGAPVPDVGKYPSDKSSRMHTMKELVVPKERVMANFELYGLLDAQVEFVEGWFKDSLPRLRKKSFSVIRLDCNLYGSIMAGLENLYPSLSPGGGIIVDDYQHMPACKQAVDDYREKHGVQEELVKNDWSGVYWRKKS